MYVSGWQRRVRSIVIDNQYNDLAATAGEVIVADGDAIDTGLIDGDGRPIYRVRDRIRLGFEGRGNV